MKIMIVNAFISYLKKSYNLALSYSFSQSF